MEFDEIICKHTDTIMNDYHVNSLIAKVIEQKQLTKESFSTLNEAYDYSLDNVENGLQFKEKLQELLDNKARILIISDPELDHLFASTIIIRALAKLKANFDIKYINKDESMLRGNIICIHDTISLKMGETIIETTSDLSLATTAYILLKNIIFDTYSVTLASLGNILKDIPLKKENRTLFKLSKKILEEKRYIGFERFIIDKDKRNDILFYGGGKNHKPYQLNIIRDQILNPLIYFLMEDKVKRWNTLLKYFFTPTKMDASLERFVQGIKRFQKLGNPIYHDLSAIEVTIDEISKESIKEMQDLFEPYDQYFERPFFILKNIKVDERRKFAIAKGLELSFKTDHGLIKATAYDNEASHTEVSEGDIVDVIGHLTIHSFSSLPGFNLFKIINHSK